MAARKPSTTAYGGVYRSKSIESQQDEAERQRHATRGRSATPAERATIERRRGLELARAKSEADLRAASRPVHRQMLASALAAIDEQLRSLGDELKS